MIPRTCLFHSSHRGSNAVSVFLVAIVAAVFAYFGGIKQAHAVPSFARKYKTSCVTCHTVFPKLNPFGEAFRRDGFRFPSKDGSVDSDNVQAQMLPLGQDEYKKLFPNSVWPDSITQAPPLSMLLVAGTAVNFPKSGAHDAAGNTFGWNDFIQEAHIFGAGAFNDKLTYFTELTFADGGVEIENAYLIWSDIVGPRHLVNLNIGRFGPTLNSFGQHGTYADDLQLPGISVGQLYNGDSPSENPAEGYGHPDGLELNGIVAHRFDYSVGWKASGIQDGIDGQTPNSQDVYAHIGYKFCGMSLDGEGRCGAQVANPKKPWSETSLTIDAFGYHSLARFDSQTVDANGNPVMQDDSINDVGGSLRLDIGSFSNTLTGWLEHHSHPYVASTPGDATQTPIVTGTADNNSGSGTVLMDEVNYVVFPWLVPAVRVEYTRLSVDNNYGGGGHAALLKIQPAVAMLFRPNIKLVLAGDIENGSGTPPGGDWGAAGGSIAGQPMGQSKFEAEQITGDLLWAF